MKKPGFLYKRFSVALQGRAGTARRKLVSGFTFVEALIAMSIVVIAFINILYLVNFSVGRLREARDFMVGSYLAQEGVELITMRRNENWLNQQAFNAGLDPGTYRIDYPGTFDSGIGIPLKFDEQTGYQYAQGADTPFVRAVTISQPALNFMRVQSRVSWTERGDPRSVIVEDSLYDWFSVPEE